MRGRYPASEERSVHLSAAAPMLWARSESIAGLAKISENRIL